MRILQSFALVVLLGSPLRAQQPALPGAPGARLNLVVAAPVSRWDDALPLGNGLLGGLLWGEGTILRLSLDRGDLWDERTHGEQQWWKKHNYEQGVRAVADGNAELVKSWWDAAYRGVSPTKLPAGRLEIQLTPGRELLAFELNLRGAEGWAKLADKSQVSAFFSATAPVAMLRIPGEQPLGYRLLPSGAEPAQGSAPSSGGAVKNLGYPDAVHGEDGSARWYVQEAAEGLQYCVCMETRRVDGATLLALSITSTRDGPAPLKLARSRCSLALEEGYAPLFKAHETWWSSFWSQSGVSLPEQDAHILRQYYLVQYFHGAASRRGAPPMPLQGVWTADNGGLPPWKGDYHNDLNTQMTYIAYQSAGHFDEGLSYLDFLWERRSVFQDFARDFYGTKGLACPGVMSLAGQPLGGWGQYSLSPTMTAWSAHLFYLHWRYTMDDAFLRERAYPWVRDTGLCMLGLLQADENGVLKLPLSTSPEVFNNAPEAWLKPNSNYDLMCLRMLFLSLQEMADAVGEPAESDKWAKAASDLGDYHTDARQALLIAEDTPLPGSHRHLSNLIAIHPFNLLTSDGGGQDAARIDASLKQWDELGTRGWVGYSFSWYSCLLARVGRAEQALRHLDIFTSAFITRNGFHVNGDQTKSGFSGFTYRPFTLEGNFLAAQAVQEMLLQSWSPSPGVRDTEVIRIFPAMPWRWHDASFRDLRVEGGHRVSAVRQRNATTWLRVTAGRNATVRIRNNFGDRPARWNLPGVELTGQNYVVKLKRGQVLEGTFEVPREQSARPADAADEVIIKNGTAK